MPECKRLTCTNEELAAIGVWPRIGHRQGAWHHVGQLEVLVLELGAVNALATGAVVVGEVATLAHELGNHPEKR